jgi:hypothetical protein
LSFFEEDDDTPRRTTRPRRAAMPRADAGDPQSIMVRRAVALAAGVLLLIVLALVVNSCLDSRRTNALKDYNSEIGAIVSESDSQVGKPFFTLLSQGGESPQDLQTAINGYRVTAEQQLDRAERLSVPDDMKGAHHSVLVALELRSDGLAAVAENVSTALGDRGEAADQAISQIAGQMQAFLSSDVLWQARVVPLIKKHLDDASVGGQRIAESRFLPDISWLQEGTVADRLGQQISGGSSTDGAPAPGLHGNGLVSVAAGDITLQPGVANRIPATTDAFLVSFANQGENDEFEVKVRLEIKGGGKTITAERTVDEIRQGQTAEVALPLDETPPVGQAVTITVEVLPVPGEEKTDNNSQTYQAIFVQ